MPFEVDYVRGPSVEPRSPDNLLTNRRPDDVAAEIARLYNDAEARGGRIVAEIELPYITVDQSARNPAEACVIGESVLFLVTELPEPQSS